MKKEGWGGGGGEWRNLNIKAEHGEYEFDLCRKGQQGLTFDMCKDTVAPKPLINTHTHCYKAVSRHFHSLVFSLSGPRSSLCICNCLIQIHTVSPLHSDAFVSSAEITECSLSNWEAAASPCLFRLLVFWYRVCSLGRKSYQHNHQNWTAEYKIAPYTVNKAASTTSGRRWWGGGKLFSFPSDTKKRRYWSVEENTLND